MTFDVFCIRGLGEAADQAMFPVLDDAGTVSREPLDGDGSQHLVANGLAVREAGGSKTRTVTELREIRADVFITDARVILQCAKYDKGGGWVGSPGLSLALNAVSKIRAARRSRGTALVGHVRYPWLASVGFSPKQGWLDEEVLRLVVRDGTADPTRLLLVDLSLPKEVDSAAVARAIMLRAAAYRTTHEELADDEQAGFDQLAASPEPPRPQPKKFAVYTMPTSWHAKPATAYPRPA
jgi:hypothetical protein